MTTRYKANHVVAEPDLPFKIWHPVYDSGAALPMRAGRGRALKKARLRDLARVALTKPDAPKRTLTGEHDVVYESSSRVMAERSFEQQQGGPDKTILWQLDQGAIAAWRDRQANPDDYEPEVTLCECGEAIIFEVTRSGTLTERCATCGWVDSGRIYEHNPQPTRGAFGEPSPLRCKRRFWSVEGSGVLSVKPVEFRNAPERDYAAQEEVGALIAPNAVPHPSYSARRSQFADVIAFARRGEPFVVPIPAEAQPAKYRQQVWRALSQHKSTCMGRWSVDCVQEGLRVGLVGSWH